MWDERTDSIDRHIDAAARAMTAGAVRGDFAARVVRQISSAPVSEPSPTRSLEWAATIAAAAAIVVAVVFVAGRHRPANQQAVNTVSTPQPARATAEVPSRGGTAAHGHVTRRPDVVARAARPAPREADADSLPMLDIAPLAVTPLTTAAITVDEAAAPQPLDVTPIVVAPLTPQGER